jgi:hypothetical protein
LTLGHLAGLNEDLTGRPATLARGGNGLVDGLARNVTEFDDHIANHLARPAALDRRNQPTRIFIFGDRRGGGSGVRLHG